MKTGYDSFEDLHIWQEGIKLCVDVYHILKDNKNFGLRDQIQRSAISVPSNIAEGFERHTDKEFIRFLYMAKGSCGELRTQILVAISVFAIEPEYGQPLIDRARKISGMIQNLIKARKRNGKR
jgi:four helix bundle protein